MHNFCMPCPGERCSLVFLLGAAAAPSALLHLAYYDHSGCVWTCLALAATVAGSAFITLGLHATGRRWALMSVLALTSLTTLFLGGYSNAFSDAPSVYSLFNTASEGLQVLPAWILFVPWVLFALLILSLGGIFWLAPRTRPASFRALLGLLGVWILAQGLGLAMARQDPWFTSHRHRVVLGFWGTSLADGYRAFRAWDDTALVRDVEEDARRRPPRSLGRAQPITSRVLILQLESLDWNVLHRNHQGRPILPFLNRLSDRVPPLLLDPNHVGPSGSSGAEFQLLTGLRPVARKPAFTLNRMDWKKHGLPWLLRQRGYKFLAFHGNEGTYWNRRQPFLAAGVNRFYERRDILPVPDMPWGTSDHALFDRMLETLPAHPGPLVVFAITMTSHTPFHYAPPVFTYETGTLARFFNSLHYLDRELERFLLALPPGEAWTVILYGDHASRVQSEAYDSLLEGKERVPAWFFTWQHGEATPLALPDLAPLERTSGQLEIVSLNEFLRRNLQDDRRNVTSGR